MAFSSPRLRWLCQNDIIQGVCGLALHTFSTIVFSGLDSASSILCYLARILLKDVDGFIVRELIICRSLPSS